MVENKGGDRMDGTSDFLELCTRVAQQRLPYWDELPDLELYMDQVLSLMERYLGSYPGFDRKGLTASMVNNYVKLGVMPPPVKKKYTRTHLAHLIVICVLKPCLPIDSIKNMIASSARTEETDGAGYDQFCALFEETVRDAAGDASEQVKAAQGRLAVPVYRAALRAQAEQALSRKLYEAAFEGV